MCMWSTADWCDLPSSLLLVSGAGRTGRLEKGVVLGRVCLNAYPPNPEGPSAGEACLSVGWLISQLWLTWLPRVSRQ